MRSYPAILRVLALLPLVLVVPRSLPQTTMYQGVELGTLGGADTEAYALNDYGQVVGRSLDAGGLTHMVLWQNGEIIDLAVEQVWNRRLQQLDYSVGLGISNTDHVVGATQCSGTDGPDAVGSDVPGGAYILACLFRPSVMSDPTSPYPGQSLTYLGTMAPSLNTVESSAVNISPNGQYIVGWSDVDANNRIHAFLAMPVGGVWAPDTIICGDPLAPPYNPLLIDLGTLPTYDANSSATAVNRLGQVVGWSYSPTYGYHAFLWQGGAMTDLGTLGGGSENNSWARDINDDGQIVGESDVGTWLTHAFIWIPATHTMTDLGTLGGSSSSACAINNAGQVVGWSLNSQNAKRAFIITPRDTDGDGQPDQWFVDADGNGVNDLMTDLNDFVQSGFKVVMTEARDINDGHGQVIGFGTSGTAADAPHLAFILTPSGTVAEGSTVGGTRQDAVLEPVQAGSSDTNGNDQSSNGDTTTTGVVPLSGLHFLCGYGFTSFLPFALAGLCAVKVGCRRR